MTLLNVVCPGDPWADRGITLTWPFVIPASGERLLKSRPRAESGHFPSLGQASDGVHQPPTRQESETPSISVSFQTVVLERTLESPLDSKEIKLVNPKGNQPWILTGRAEAEAPILWLPDAKNRLAGKHPDAGKDWEQEEKGTTEDEMAGRHHRLDGHELHQTLGDRGGQGSLVCCSPRDRKESDTTEQLTWTERLNSSNKGGRTVRQSHQDGLTSGWPVGWTQAFRGSSPHPHPWSVHSAHCSYSGSCSKDTTLE